jgi:hypothetical protein
MHGPSLNRINMLRNAALVPAVVALRHTGNLPVPDQEFPVYYNATYHVKMYYRSPIGGSRNTVAVKPFTLRYEEVPYNGSTVLY